MRVTKIGPPPGDRLWYGRCSTCKSEAEANESELTGITHDQREGTSFSWEPCPVCEAGTKLNGYGGMIFYRGRR